MTAHNPSAVPDHVPVYNNEPRPEFTHVNLDNVPADFRETDLLIFQALRNALEIVNPNGYRVMPTDELEEGEIRDPEDWWVPDPNVPVHLLPVLQRSRHVDLPSEEEMAFWDEFVEHLNHHAEDIIAYIESTNSN